MSVSQRCTICKIHVDYSNILRKLCVFGFTISSFFDEFVSTEVVVVESSIADTVQPIFKWWKQTQKVICFQQAHTIMMVSSYQNQEASKQAAYFVMLCLQMPCIWMVFMAVRITILRNLYIIFHLFSTTHLSFLLAYINRMQVCIILI